MRQALKAAEAKDDTLREKESEVIELRLQVSKMQTYKDDSEALTQKIVTLEEQLANLSLELVAVRMQDSRKLVADLVHRRSKRPLDCSRMVCQTQPLHGAVATRLPHLRMNRKKWSGSSTSSTTCRQRTPS